jgi:hypothetical protein
LIKEQEMRGHEILAYVVCLLATPQALARSFAGMEFAVPQGWQVTSGDSSIFLSPPGLENDQAVIATLTPDAPLRDFRAQFDRAVQRAQALGTPVNAGKVASSRASNASETLRQIISVRRSGAGTMYMMVTGSNADSRFRAMVLAASSFDLLSAHVEPADVMFESIKYTGKPRTPGVTALPQSAPRAPEYVDAASRRDGEKNLAPLPPGCARLDGLYVTQDSGGTIGPGGNFYSTTTFRFYYFMPNGYTYMGAKLAGLENLRCNAPTVDKYGRPLCTTYAADGDMIRIGPQNPTRLRRKGQDLRIGDYDFALVPKANNLRLSGTYESYLGGSVAQSNLGFSFGRDGRFTTSNFTGIAVDNDPTNSGMSGGARVSVAGSSQSDAQGTYRINGYTLDLTYASGRKVQAFFAPVAGMEVLRIGSRVYTRQ